MPNQKKVVTLICIIVSIIIIFFPSDENEDFSLYTFDQLKEESLSSNYILFGGDQEQLKLLETYLKKYDYQIYTKDGKLLLDFQNSEVREDNEKFLKNFSVMEYLVEESGASDLYTIPVFEFKNVQVIEFTENIYVEFIPEKKDTEKFLTELCEKEKGEVGKLLFTPISKQNTYKLTFSTLDIPAMMYYSKYLKGLPHIKEAAPIVIMWKK